MGKKGGAEEGTAANGKKKSKEERSNREGHDLLGQPTFTELDNGRFKCVESGHELPNHARESYAQSKHCRLALIDHALARSKPPLNMFQQDPQSSSKLICKLTGVVINKSEEHLWKHISGKRFLNALERMETEQKMPNGMVEKQDDQKIEKKKKKRADGLEKKKKKKKKEQENAISEGITEVTDASENNGDIEGEDDFWMPPVGDRWDFDDGGDRWGSDTDSVPENDDMEDAGDQECKSDARELSGRTKRMSEEIGPSSYASRKKNKTKAP